MTMPSYPSSIHTAEVVVVRSRETKDRRRRPEHPDDIVVSCMERPSVNIRGTKSGLCLGNPPPTFGKIKYTNAWEHTSGVGALTTGCTGSSRKPSV